MPVILTADFAESLILYMKINLSFITVSPTHHLVAVGFFFLPAPFPLCEWFVVWFLFLVELWWEDSALETVINTFPYCIIAD